MSRPSHEDIEKMVAYDNPACALLLTILEKLGVTSFGEVGEPFDPNIHNAVMHVEDESKGENEIAAVFSKGYRLGDRILRPAMVQVAN